MYYNNDDEYNYYINHFYRYPTPTLVPTATVQQQLNLGRQGHCFKSFWGGREHTFNLMGIDAQGMVSIMEGGMPNSVHQSDMVSLTYLGVQCPTPQSGGMGTGMGQGMGQGIGQGMGQGCGWVWTQQGWRWVCR